MSKGSRAAKTSWRAACGPRAALWPPLLYIIVSQTKFFRDPYFFNKNFHDPQLDFLSYSK